MFNKIKKHISDNTGFLIRLDDIAENMNWDMMEKVTNLFDKFKIKPVLGIIPNNKDPELLSYPKKNINFWEQARAWKKKVGKLLCMAIIMFTINFAPKQTI